MRDRSEFHHRSIDRGKFFRSCIMRKTHPGVGNLRIALLIAHNAQNKRRSSWGGTVDYMTEALQKYCGDVYHITPEPSKVRLLGKVFHKLSRLVLKKNFLYNHTFLLAKRYAKTTARKLADQPF